MSLFSCFLTCCDKLTINPDTEEMWKLYASTASGIAVCCHICGGGWVLTCECAHRRFRNAIQKEHIAKYKQLKDDKEKEKFVHTIC